MSQSLFVLIAIDNAAANADANGADYDVYHHER